MLVEERTHSVLYLVAHDQVVLHFRTAQVQVAVFEADLFVDVDVVFDVERRCLRGIQDAQFFAAYFDRTGFHLVVDRISVTHADDTTDDENIFRTDLFCFFKGFFFIIRRSDDLDDTGAVAEIDEDQSAVVAAAFNPATKNDLFVLVCF